MTDLGSLAVEAGPKAALYGALLLAIGASATRWLLLPRLAAEWSPAWVGEVEASLARLSRVSASFLLASLALRAWLHTVAVFGWRDSLAWDQIAVIILESRWGAGWRVQVAATICLLAATFIIRVHRSAGWVLTTACVLACALSIPLLGHAEGQPLRVALHAAHIVGAGMWLGTLACVLLVRGVPIRALKHFAPIALAGASMAVAAGAIAAVQYVGSLGNLWETAYGRALVVKLTIFAAVLCCGYLNWRRWSASSLETGAERPVRLPILEVLLAAAIVLVTSVLTELAHP